MNYLCITIDGLHNGMIGAYGNGWVRTPTLDLLASESVVFDRYYTDSMDLSSIFESLWLNEPGAVLPTLRSKKYRTILLTDDTDVFAHQAAKHFDEVHRFEIPNENAPAQSVEETQFVEAFATAVDILETKKGAPFFFWLHLRGFRGPWDFPPESRKETQAEGDPEPYDGVAPPNVDAADELDPDVLQSVMEAYAGGMSVLDQALSGLLESVQEKIFGGETLFVFGSTRGFSLGEHRRIGIDSRLYGENVHLPLCIRFPDGFGATVRSPILIQPNDLGEFLCNMNSLVDLIRDGKEELHETLLVAGENGETAIVTPEWFLRSTQEPGASASGVPVVELYAKPDDRWEINNVGDRCQNEVEILLQQSLLQGAEKYCAGDKK